MSRRRLLALCGMLLLGGCLYHVREETDLAICDLSSHPYDLLPSMATEPAATTPPVGKPPSRDPAAPGEKSSVVPPSNPTVDIQTTAWMQGKTTPQASPPSKAQYDLHIPPEIPGSEAKTIQLSGDTAAKQHEIQRLYPELPPLLSEPVPEPGPNGRPYTLAELQQIAAANSWQLQQAAYDVQFAKGNLIQAKAYPNPTVGYEVDPSNDGSTPGVQGVFVDQTVKFAGKLKLQTAAAEMDLRNAELALKRARSDLATQVRSAYFGVLVAKETVRVNRALARFTDEIYRIQTGMLGGGFAAPYEPATLRAQAHLARVAYNQSIQNYIYAWKPLVAAIGLRQLPLSDIAGRVDSALPYYDYDAVLAQVLRTHTDVLTARNGIDKAKYNLKFAQITPYPDVDFRVAILKEYVLPPKQTVPTLQVGVPFPVWDQNKGTIIAAEAALGRASEEPHRVEMNLTTNLANAYNNYKNSLLALEDYRKFILPDQVRAYRGVFERRQIDPNSAFADLVTAQQTLAANVASYLTILSQLWTSVVSVADLLQTDDLFQLAQPRELPPLPDLDHMTPWPCCHVCPTTCSQQTGAIGTGCPAPRVSSAQPLPAPSGAALPASEIRPLPVDDRWKPSPIGNSGQQ